MRKVFPYLTQGISLCLCGFGFWFLWRKLSLKSSEDSSETTQQALNDLEKWKRGVELELETQFDRVKSVCGRIDREKRGSRQAAPELVDEDEQAKLNRLMAQKFHGVG